MRNVPISVGNDAHGSLEKSLIRPHRVRLYETLLKTDRYDFTRLNTRITRSNISLPQKPQIV